MGDVQFYGTVFRKVWSFLAIISSAFEQDSPAWTKFCFTLTWRRKGLSFVELLQYYYHVMIEVGG